MVWSGVGTLAVALGRGTSPAQRANLTPIGRTLAVALGEGRAYMYAYGFPFFLPQNPQCPFA